MHSHMESSLLIPRKDKHAITSDPNSRLISQIIENRSPNKNLFMNILGSTICNSQNVETSQMSMSG